MYIIACIDDRNGMLFNKRRVSSDKTVTERIYQQACSSRLWVNEYSAKLFEGLEKISVDSDFLAKAKEGEYCLVENVDITEYKNSIEKLIVYRWNRKYPSDFKLPLEAVCEGMKLESSEDFKGNSHEKVTLEVYSR